MTLTSPPVQKNRELESFAENSHSGGNAPVNGRIINGGGFIEWVIGKV
jgi:hypothetical protein